MNRGTPMLLEELDGIQYHKPLSKVLDAIAHDVGHCSDCRRLPSPGR